MRLNAKFRDVVHKTEKDVTIIEFITLGHVVMAVYYDKEARTLKSAELSSFKDINL